MIAKKLLIYIYVIFLIFLIIAPLLKSGYILALDLTFTPKLRPPGEITNTYLWEWFLHFSNRILPSQIIEKIFFFLVLFLSWLGAYRLTPTKSQTAKIFAGTLYMINPFVYSRFLYGQLHLLIAYSLLPFAVAAIFRYLENPDYKKALKVSLWLSLVSIVHLRTLSIIGVFFIVGLAIKLLFERSRKQWILLFKTFLTMTVSFVIFNIYWLWSFLEKKNDRIQTLLNVDTRHIQIFQTVADSSYGLLLNILGLYGFWGDIEGRYIPQKELVPLWPILMAIIIAFAIIGLAYALKRKKLRLPAAIMFIGSLFAFIFIVGVAHPWFAPFNIFLTERFILFKGLREPQKNTAILCLGYAYFGAIGIDFIYQKLKNCGKIIPNIFSLAIIMLPIAYSPGLFWGFRGQLYPVDYPKSWHEINEKLNQDSNEFKVLFLPWHQYLSFNFTKGKIIHNPAEQFFDKPTIAGDNLEMGPIYTQSQRSRSEKIQELIAKGQNGQNIIQELSNLNIKYIILAKTVNWKDYGFLDRQQNLRLIHETNELKLYQRNKER